MSEELSEVPKSTIDSEVKKEQQEQIKKLAQESWELREGCSFGVKICLSILFKK
mgnify:CR=1 FL=1